MCKCITSFFAYPGVHNLLDSFTVIILLLLACFPCHFNQVVRVCFEVVLVLFIAATQQICSD